MSTDRTARVRRRWWTMLALSFIVPATLVVGFGHRGVHVARNLLVPGAGLYDRDHYIIGIAFTVAFVASVIVFVRWGAEWLVVAVVAGACIASAVLFSRSVPAASGALASARHGPPISMASHEFPLVVLVASAWGWVRLALLRAGIGRRRSKGTASGLDALATLGPVERCEAVAIARLASALDGDVVDHRLVASCNADDVRRRAQRVGLVARGRRRGDPFRIDHAHARAARSLLGLLTDDERARFVADAHRSFAGAPCSEPGWVRLLDGTLAALALQRVGSHDAAVRWASALGGVFATRGSHRPACVWTPLALPVAHALPWEHAAATGLARAARWCDDSEWPLLRKSALGAAARGARRPADERLVAAARIWTAFVDDAQASQLLARPTIGRDPLASALDRLASRLRDDPDLLIATTILTPPVEVQA